MITYSDNTNERRTVIIAGINGDIGKEFATRYSPEDRLFGIMRKIPSSQERYIPLIGDLLKKDDVSRIFNNLPYTNSLTYIHLPGKFQFQDENYPIKDENGDGVDDDIFATNVETFRNVKPYLLEYLKQNPSAHLKIVGIGSASDIYDIPFWHSFTYSKNELRKEFRSLYGNPQTYGRVSSLFINISTTDGAQLSVERPHISKEYTLTPKEVLDQALPYINDDRPSSLEITVIKPNPHFVNPAFLDLQRIRERWYADMRGHYSTKE